MANPRVHAGVGYPMHFGKRCVSYQFKIPLTALALILLFVEKTPQTGHALLSCCQ
jgi:hypothetical protein